jgi:hypothetical protein
MMENKSFVRVGCLQVGYDYFLRLPPGDHSLPIFTKVKFIEITTCPAVVMVQDQRKNMIKCNRSDLYIPAG